MIIVDFMQQSAIHIPPMPSTSLYEYLLVASPDKQVSARVMEEKEAFYSNYHTEKFGLSAPHITISSFIARDEMEDTLIRWLQRIIGEQHGFSVTLNNYSGIPPHTVFLRVQDPAPFRELTAQLKPIDFYVKSNDCPPVRFSSCPHLSIARKLPEMVYDKAIAEYARKLFNESFEVAELVLLRRQHQYDTCKQIAIFRMQPSKKHFRS